MTLEEYLLSAEPLNQRIMVLLSTDELLADQRWILGEQILESASEEEKAMHPKEVGRLESLIRLRRIKKEVKYD